jgi:hypothetical protein
MARQPEVVQFRVPDRGDSAQVRMILYKRRGIFRMAACRGTAKGCQVMNDVRAKLGPCQSCILCDDPDETIGQVYDKIQKGNA